MTFSFQEIEALAQGRFTHPHPFVRCKMEAVLLKTANLRHELICQLCGICGNTLRSYLADMLMPLTQVSLILRFKRKGTPKWYIFGAKAVVQTTENVT